MSDLVKTFRLVDLVVMIVLGLFTFYITRMIGQYDQGVADASKSLNKIELLQVEMHILNDKVDKMEQVLSAKDAKLDQQLEKLRETQDRIIGNSHTRGQQDDQNTKMIRDMWERKK